jgi:putative SOS response-associated peptidase YedK
MPVILEGDARERWLSLDETRPEMLQDLLVSSEIEGLVSERVSSQYVNHGVDDERCIQRIW